MSQTKEKIITGADNLLALVNEKEKISITQAAEELKVDKKIIEAWAEIFSENNMLIIEVGLRNIFLLKNNCRKKSADATKNDKKNIVEYLSSRIKHTLYQTEIEYKKFKPFEKKLKKIEENLNAKIRQIEKKEKELKNVESHINNVEKKMIMSESKFNKRIEDTKNKIIELEKKQIGHEIELVQRLIENYKKTTNIEKRDIIQILKNNNLDESTIPSMINSIKENNKIITSVKNELENIFNEVKDIYYKKETKEHGPINKEINEIKNRLDSIIPSQKIMFCELRKEKEELLFAKNKIEEIIRSISKSREYLKECCDKLTDKTVKSSTDLASELKEINAELENIEKSKSIFIKEVHNFLNVEMMDLAD